MQEHEEKIKQLRTLEAKKKDLMGLNGKLGHILLRLGQPIINHQEGGKYFEQQYLDLDPYGSETEEGIPYSDTMDAFTKQQKTDIISRA